MGETEWQAYREKQVGIGGSDVATILGLNPFKSRFVLWLEKTKQKAPDIVDNDAVTWGNILEPVVRDHFKKETGFKVFQNNFVLQHDKFDWMLANIDGEVIDPFFDGRGILEIKTTNERNKKAWENGCPVYYQCQVFHYLAVTGYEYAYICCLIGGSTFKYYLIERDDYIIDQIIKAEMIFMEQVRRRIPPEIGGTNDEKNWLAATFPEAIEEEKILPSSLEELALEYTELQKEIKDKTLRCDEIKNKIKLEAKDFKRLQGNRVKINMPTIEKVMFDNKVFAVEHPELYEQYKTKQSSYRGFTVSLVDD
jgi:putative phage-type endonuclease